MKIINLKAKNLQIPAVFEAGKTLPVVSLKLIFKVAGVCAEEKAGLAKFVAKIFDEGTLSKGASAFAKELEVRAINLYASAGFETFSFELNCLKEHFSFALAKLKELLDEPNLSQKSLEKVRTLTLGEISGNESDYDYLAKTALNELLYPGTNLARPSIGTKQSVESITLKDVKNFIASKLDLANLFVVLGGEVAPEELNLDEVLSSLKVGEPRELKHLKTSEKLSEKTIIKPSEQAYVYFGAPFSVPCEERFKARVATFILGDGGFGSRLMEEIRVKRGLAYSAYARSEFALSYSQIWGYLQTKNESRDEAVAVVKDEFKKFVKNGVKAGELAQAKRFLLGSQPLRQETLFNRLSIAQGEFYNGFKLGNFKDELEKISKLKLAELNAFIAKHAEIEKLSFAVLYNEI